MSSGFLRFSTRIALAALIPVAVITWLIYSAAERQSLVEARNMRWLGQMATQIHNLVRNQERIVRDSSKDELRITENLTTAGDCDKSKNLGVYDGAEGPKLFFRQAAEDKTIQCATADLTKLVERALRPGVFDSVILAQRSGPVLYQSNPGTLRLTNVQFLFAPPQETSKLEMLLGGDKVDPKIAAALVSPSLPTATMHLTRSIGDRAYGVSVQPVRILVSDAGKEVEEGNWLLIGLNEKGASWRKSAPYGVVVILPLVLLLVAVCWPLPRPWHLPLTAPFRRRDLTLIAVCTLIVLAIFAVLGVFHATRVLTDARTDHGLTILADSIGKNLRYELTLIVRQMREFDQEALAAAAFESKDSVLGAVPLTRIHSLFDYVDWIDPKGDKNVRWSSRAARARSLNVVDRGYFRAVMANRLLPLDNDWFTIEQVLSRTSNRLLTVVATKSQHPGAAAMSAGIRPFSVLSTVLPRDFGFAIIEPDGRVIFHSEPGRALVENLFEETEDAPELRSATERRVQAFVESNYSGSAHRMMITPIPGLEQVPWTLAVFRSLDPVRLNRLQSLAGTVALFVSYAAVLIAIWMALLFLLPAFRHKVVPRSIFDMTWWSRGTSSYPAVAAAGVVLLLIDWRAIHRLEGSSLFYVAVASAFAFLLVSAVGLRRSRRPSASPRAAKWLTAIAAAASGLALVAGDWLMVLVAPVLAFGAGVVLSRLAYGSRSPAARRLQTAAWMAWTVELALCLVIVPAFLAGQVAWQFESGLYVRDAQWNLQQDDEMRRRQLTTEIENLPGVPDNAALRSRLLSLAGLLDREACPPIYLYGAPGFDTFVWPSKQTARPHQPCNESTCPPEPPCAPGARQVGAIAPTALQAGGFWSKLQAGLPSFVLAAVEVPVGGRRRGFSMRMVEMRPAGNLWEWRHSGDSQEHHLWLVKERTVAARSTHPSYIPLDLFSPQRWRDGQVLELWVAFQFWAGVAAVSALLLWWVLRLVSRVLLLNAANGPVLAAFQPERDSAHPRLFLLAQPGGTASGVPDWAAGFVETGALVQPDSLPQGPLFFTHLESHFEDEAARLAWLALLEAALRDPQRRIVIRSTIDPVHYLTTGGAGALGQPASAPELARWRRVMSYFRPFWLPARCAPGLTGYSQVWDSCSYQEQLLLTYLAEHKLVNPMAWPLVQALRARCIIRRRPSLRFDFRSSGFQDFVRAQGLKPYALEGASAAAPTRLPPYAIALVMFGIVLFFSQEEITSRLVGFLTTLMGGFEAIRRQFAGAGDSASKARK